MYTVKHFHSITWACEAELSEDKEALQRAAVTSEDHYNVTREPDSGAVHTASKEN